MHPRIQEILHHLDSTRERLRAVVDAVPPELRELPPGPRRWSVAEVVEHLSLVERRVAELLAQYLAAARTGGGLPAERGTGSVLDTLDLDLLLDRERPLVAAQSALPRGIGWAAAWEALEQARSELRETLVGADGMALGEVVHPHPVAGPLDLYQWAAFAGVHEARHTAQLAEIAASLRAAQNG